MSLAEHDLARVKRAAVKVASSREQLHAAIRDAYEDGQALRKIAEAADMSHEQVRRILSR